MINKIFILGELAKKNVSETKNNTPLCVLEIVTNKNFKDSKGTKKNIIARHIVNCYGTLANIAGKYAETGDLIFVEGEMLNKKIEEEGLIKMINNIIAIELKVMTLKNKKGNNSYEK